MQLCMNDDGMPIAVGSWVGAAAGIASGYYMGGSVGQLLDCAFVGAIFGSLGSYITAYDVFGKENDE